MEESKNIIASTLAWAALQQEFSRCPELTRSQVLAFYHHHTPTLKQPTLDGRIHQLVQQGLLISAGRGRYALATTPVRPNYRPQPDDQLKTVWRYLKPLQLPEGCLWSTACLNEFTQHLTASHFLVVEVPRDYLSAVFIHLQNRYHRRTFLNPKPEVLAYYVKETVRPILVIPSVSRAPVQRINGVSIPRLEKLLVDLYSCPSLFSAYQGHELMTIFTNARRQYFLDERTMLCYAQRRHKADELRKFLALLPPYN